MSTKPNEQSGGGWAIWSTVRNPLMVVLLLIMVVLMIATGLVLVGQMGAGDLLSGILGGILPAIMTFTSPIGLLVSVAALAHVMTSMRRRRGVTVLTYLEQAVRLNMPLPQMLFAAARSEKGKTGRRLAGLAEGIASGLDITVALEYAVPELHGRPLRLLQAAQSLGHLPRAMRDLLAEQRQADQQGVSDRMFMVVYPLAMTVMMTLIVGMIIVFVMPRFEQIFKDFRTPLPRLTRIMMHSTEWPLFILACLAGAAFAWFVLSQLASMIWPSPRPLFRGITDRLTWCLPLLGQMARNRGLADVFGIAGQATRDGYPLDRALAQAATLDLNLTLAGRVQRWQRAVESGTPLSQAAKQAGMPALAVGMLSTAQVAGQAGEVFGFLTTYYAQRFSRAAILLRAAVVPLLALFFGILVALICVSILMPMVSLVNNMPVFPRIR